ncbi:hypothetical protein DH2020_031289 [Rehmannia glutinosa]|uniref:Uncharacterized protein n=1 Tax=Rehmannia glutinosa TaxID=99300 RepID=A0ABR0VKR5_REHGL
MILPKTIRSRHFLELLKLQSTSNCVKNPLLTSLYSSKSSELLFRSSIYRRPFSIWALFAKKPDEKRQKRAEPLSDFFKRAVSVSERTTNGGVEAGHNSENAKLKEKLRNLEEEVRCLNQERDQKGKTLTLRSAKSDLIEENGAKVSLSALFSGEKKTEKLKILKPIDFGNEDPMVHKELSSDMQMFTHHLYMKGYLKGASFMPKNKFDVTCFQISYGREFLKFAAVKFGEDHQEIAKWLSASDLKKIALFGCPSLGQRSVYAAKSMRGFFEIEEQKASQFSIISAYEPSKDYNINLCSLFSNINCTISFYNSQQVCQKCTLKDTCKHANKRTKKSSTTQLDLAKVTRVLVMYAMESVPQQLVVPEEIINSVGRLLKEIVNLTQDTS